MTKPCPQSTEDNPNDIKGYCEAPESIVGVMHLSPERPQTKQSELESLYSDRDANDGQCHGKTPREITDGSLQSTEEPPQKVSNKAHIYNKV